MLRTFSLECADFEWNFHEIIIVAETSAEAVEIAFDLYEGLEHVYSVEEL